MNTPNQTRGRSPRWGPWLLAMILLSFAPAFAPAAAPPTVAAVQTRATVVHETPTALALLALPRILGDQKVMIQVGVVVGAIGIFWLTRSIK